MKVRSVLKGVGIALCVIFLLGFISTLFDWGKVKPEKHEYQISYLHAETGEDILTDYSFLLKSDGNYPKGYSNDDATFEISALAGERRETEYGTYITEVYDPNDPNTGYSFVGWYLDKACTQVFAGYVERGTVGDLTLYAKLSISRWTGFY